MKKISILMLHLLYGGLERQTINMANMLTDDYEVELVVLYNFHSVAYKIDPRIKIKYLMNMGSNRKELLNAIHNKEIINTIKESFKSLYILTIKDIKMINYIKHSDADILFATRIEFAKMISKYNIKGIKSIATEHNFIKTDEYIKRVQESFSGIDTLVLLTDIAQEYYKKWLSGSKTKIVVIPNILDNIPVESTRLNSNNIIAVGRFDPVKNFTGLIRVFKLVHDKDSSITLTLVGDGEERNKVQELINELGLYDSVILTGKLNSDDVRLAMLHSDMYVMTSVRECLPMVIIEAYSCGVPVAAYSVETGPQTMIKDGKTGYLIPDGDEAKMASKIVNYMHSQSIKNMMSINAKDEARKYLGINIKPKWLKLLGGLLK